MLYGAVPKNIFLTFVAVFWKLVSDPEGYPLAIINKLNLPGSDGAGDGNFAEFVRSVAKVSVGGLFIGIEWSGAVSPASKTCTDTPSGKYGMTRETSGLSMEITGGILSGGRPLAGKGTVNTFG